ncbi:UvrD-helicase domain-containing protein [Emcibacter sp. SYSU 3D8]|uniref:UvrD-helicase domain-containing protein n=1 Tax=Emcibacter sp. SYSU 3D8 TaxID=3133969 RepID=UPI0031FEEB08
MEFRIADTFTASLARLTGQEQKAVKTTAFDLQVDAAAPGMQFHKLDRARDANFWSVRVNADIRMIVHRTERSLLLCYVDHHDDAYTWAERRKIERHPTTGAAQLVEIRERVEEAVSYTSDGESQAQRMAPPAPLFANLDDAALLGYGVPPDWLADVRAATEDTLLAITDHLPQEAAEALLDLATGATLNVPVMAPDEVDPFLHPDAQRRFRVLTNVEELERALEFPWEKWAVFLHPAQRELIERGYSGPARVAGSAGTGKTVVALHRAAFLTGRDPAARVLLATFSKSLANALKIKLAHLAGEGATTERIAVRTMTGIGYELYGRLFGQPNMASPAQIRSLLRQAADALGEQRFSDQFLFAEWTDVADAWQLNSWDDYRNVARLGRKTRLGPKQREALWGVFEQVRTGLAARKLTTWPEMFGRLTAHFAGGKVPFDHAVVDEAQDVSVAELRFLSALTGGRPDGLFFAGDLGQRIFQQPFSWKALGVDVRGRSFTLRVCYRTSHQIRSALDGLLPRSVADVDGIADSRDGTVSVFNGPPPDIQIAEDEADETGIVGTWITDRLAEGVAPQEIGVFVRSERQMKRARTAVKACGAAFVELSDTVETTPGSVSIGIMHLAKGLEFRAVAVMACDDEVLPLQERIETVADESDLEEVYATERHLLYVACTRARDHLLVTGVEPGSEFLGDIALNV